MAGVWGLKTGRGDVVVVVVVVAVVVVAFGFVVRVRGGCGNCRDGWAGWDFWDGESRGDGGDEGDDDSDDTSSLRFAALAMAAAALRCRVASWTVMESSPASRRRGSNEAGSIGRRGGAGAGAGEASGLEWAPLWEGGK